MTIRRAAALLLLLLLFPAVQHATEEHINYINMYIRLDDQNQYGLHKLTKTERGRLNEVFGTITERLNDNLRNSLRRSLGKSSVAMAVYAATSSSKNVVCLIPACSRSRDASHNAETLGTPSTTSDGCLPRIRPSRAAWIPA